MTEILRSYINQVRRTSEIMHYAFCILHYFGKLFEKFQIFCVFNACLNTVH